MSDSEASPSPTEQPATTEPATPPLPSTSPKPARTGNRVALTSAAGAVGVIAVLAVVTFGILWGTASSELQDAKDDLKVSQGQLSDVRDQLADSEAEVTNTKLAFYNLERGAKYTACVQYYGGFTQGSGFNAQTAVSVASSSCATEAAWTFDIKPAP